jgi:aspartyl protease family protein
LVRFLIDTGTSSVVLSPEDARRVGFDPAKLDYVRQLQTAAGTVRGAPVMLREVTLDSLRWYDVSAIVNQTPMSTSLLGMSALGRLSGYEFRRELLILKP